MIPEDERILDWPRLNGDDFEVLAQRRTIVVVTSSPMEVHGPHLPVAADCAEGDALARRAARKLCERHPELHFVFLPPLYPAADVLPRRGSLRFRPRTVARVLEELGESLARQGFHDIWISNFHGGPRHFVAIEAACERVNRRFRARMIPVFSLLLSRLTGGGTDLSNVLARELGVDVELLRGDSHGGAVETSMLLAILGRDVAPSHRSLPRRTPELELAAAGKAPLQRGARPTLLEIARSFPIRFRYFERETYAGAPAAASAQAGERILELLSTKAADALDELLAGALSPRDCHSPLWPMRHLLLSELGGALFEKLVATKPRPV